MTRKRWTLLGVAAVVVAAAIVVPLVVLGGGSKHKGGVLPPQDVVAGGQLRDLLLHGEQVTHHATYSVTGDPAKVQGLQSLDVWRRGTSLREDSLTRAGTQTVHTISLQLPSGSVLCVQTNTQPWSCQKQGAPKGTNPSSPAGLLTGVPNVSGQIVTTDKSVVDGRPVQCFTVTSLLMCVTEDGIPAKISSPDISYQLTALQTTVGDDVFKPPATPR
jgi:hypothetical protein